MTGRDALLLNPNGEVVIEGGTRRGAVAHRRLTHQITVPGRHAPVSSGYPACGPKPPADQPSPHRDYSAGWAAAGGAIACTDPKCFGGENR